MPGLSGLSLTKDEQILVGRAQDMLRGGRTGFTSFLTEREQVILQYAGVLHNSRSACYGGYPEAERVMLGVFPVDMAVSLSAFPISPITICFPRQASITHRDILGSLMGLLITRESIGDILVDERQAFVFLTKLASDIALNELSKIGSTGVRCEAGVAIDTLPQQQYQLSETTVSSMRIDSIVAAMLHKSRAAACSVISSDLVRHNGIAPVNMSLPVASGDKISIRGYGKALIIDKGTSKKGRIRIEIRKYL